MPSSLPARQRPRQPVKLRRTAGWWTLASAQLLALLGLILGAASPGLHSALFHGDWEIFGDVAEHCPDSAPVEASCGQSDAESCPDGDSKPFPAADTAHNCLLCALPQGLAIGGFPSVALDPPALGQAELPLSGALSEALPTRVVDPGCPPRGPPVI